MAEAILFAVLLALTQLLPEFRYQRTFGKWLMNLRVVRDDGSASPTTRSTLLRFVNNIGLAGIALGLVFFVVKRGLTLSDVLTKTRVTYDWDSES